MKKSTLFLSALALSIGMAVAPVSSAFAAETASSSTTQVPSLAPMLEKVMPSVVSVNVEGSAEVKRREWANSSSNSLARIRHCARTARRSRVHLFARAVAGS